MPLGDRNKSACLDQQGEQNHRSKRKSLAVPTRDEGEMGQRFFTNVGHLYPGTLPSQLKQ